MMFELLHMIVQETPNEINSVKLFQQIKTLERTRNGKVEASSGLKDDILMAYLFTRWAMVQPGIERFTKFKPYELAKLMAKIELHNREDAVLESVFSVVEDISNNNPVAKKQRQIMYKNNSRARLIDAIYKR